MALEVPVLNLKIIFSKKETMYRYFSIDSYKQNVVDDIEIISPNVINKYQKKYDCNLIIIASFYHQ